MKPEVVQTYPFLDKWRAKGYQYIIVPKDMLAAGPVFGLNMDEVVLYCILKDRTRLSYENKWIDDKGRVYIIFPREEASRYIGWSKRKTVEVFARLVDAGLLTEVEQKTSKSILKKPKRLYLRQWSPPSVVHSAEELRNGGFDYYTENNIYADVGAYYVIPRVLFEDEPFQGLSLRAIMLYTIALDALHISIRFGKVDDNGLVWCSPDTAEVAKELGCSTKSLYGAYKELEDLGLVVRNRVDTGYRLYLRDYLPPPTDATPDAESADWNNLHLEEPPSRKYLHLGEEEFASASGTNDTWAGKDLPLEPETFASQDRKNPHTSLSSSQPVQPSFSGVSIGAATAPDVSGEKRERIYPMIQRQVEYPDLCDDIRICAAAEMKEAMYHLLDKSIQVICEDACFPGQYIRIGDKTIEKGEALRRYRDIDRYILYTLLTKVAEREHEIKNMDLYLHRALLKAVEDHGGAAYYTKLMLRDKREKAGDKQAGWLDEL